MWGVDNTLLSARDRRQDLRGSVSGAGRLRRRVRQLRHRVVRRSRHRTAGHARRSASPRNTPTSSSSRILRRHRRGSRFLLATIAALWRGRVGAVLDRPARQRCRGRRLVGHRVLRTLQRRGRQRRRQAAGRELRQQPARRSRVRRPAARRRTDRRQRGHLLSPAGIRRGATRHAIIPTRRPQLVAFLLSERSSRSCR